MKKLYVCVDMCVKLHVYVFVYVHVHKYMCMCHAYTCVHDRHYAPSLNYSWTSK